MLIHFFIFFFFFSSRRRHTRFDCDWSSDVCSSDLPDRAEGLECLVHARASPGCAQPFDDEVVRPLPDTESERSEERRVGKSVDLGGRRSIKKKKREKEQKREHMNEEHIQQSTSRTL